MAYRINFVGLVNFFDQGDKGLRLLLPDGTKPENPKIPPHFAEIFVLQSQKSHSKNWEPPVDDFQKDLNKIGVQRFVIDPSSTITISGLEPPANGKAAVKSDGFKNVPLLKVLEPNIDIDPPEAKTVAQIPVAAGTLDSFVFGAGSVVAQLTLERKDELVITAQPGDKILTLKKGAEIVIANTSRPGSPKPEKPEDSHFRLYGLLDKHGNSADLNEPHASDQLEQIPSAHPYLSFLRDASGEFPMPGCSVTGCCECLA